jgi:hypothetical protein
MNTGRSGDPYSPGVARGVETVQSLQDKLDAAVRRLMPGASSDLLDVAVHFLIRSLREANLRRLRAPAIILRDAHEMTEDSERALRKEGVALETLERIKELYPLAQDLSRELNAEAQLEATHGCAKCRHYSESWERSGGAQEGPGPFCEVYGGVPAFCFDFEPSRFCRDCGKRVRPKRLARGDPNNIFNVQCAACSRQDRVA